MGLNQFDVSGYHTFYYTSMLYTVHLCIICLVILLRKVVFNTKLYFAKHTVVDFFFLLRSFSANLLSISCLEFFLSKCRTLHSLLNTMRFLSAPFPSLLRLFWTAVQQCDISDTPLNLVSSADLLRALRCPII